MTQRVIGFDPGLRVTGYGVVEGNGLRPRLIEAGVIRLPADRPLGERLQQLHESAREILEEYRPSAVAIEELYSHYERPKTAILMGHARGVLYLAAATSGITVASYLPTKVKKVTTGNGHASKEQMQSAIRTQLALDSPLDPPDVADALAVALCHFFAEFSP
ncbi:MAG: crossover junction endodeoxyribonuclease RuvC [Planctomycetota bacterium]